MKILLVALVISALGNWYFEQRDRRQKLEVAALLSAGLSADLRGKNEKIDELTYQARTCSDRNEGMQIALTNIQEAFYDHSKTPEQRLAEIYDLTWKGLSNVYIFGYGP